MEKTNVMRLLEQAKVPFQTLEYTVDEKDLSGQTAAKNLGWPVEQIFKTLVLKGEKFGYFVCCIPSHEEVDLKKAAKAVNEKKVEMIPMKDLLQVTGYLRGGCSPIGMKKKFPTFFDETVHMFDLVSISAGIRGAVIIATPKDLISYIQASEADLIK